MAKSTTRWALALFIIPLLGGCDEGVTVPEPEYVATFFGRFAEPTARQPIALGADPTSVVAIEVSESPTIRGQYVPVPHWDGSPPEPDVTHWLRVGDDVEIRNGTFGWSWRIEITWR